MHGYGQGDQHVRVIVKTPAKLTSDQKRLLEELEKTSTSGDSHANKGGKGLFNKVKGAFEA